MASALEFLSNKLLEGDLLADKLSAGLLPAEEALQYALQVGKALMAAHARGLVYARLSPDFVLIADDAAHLIRLGKVAGPSVARYRSPEQVRGGAVDWRSDIFSYGVLLYEMATGKRAFSGEGAELDEAILHTAPASLMAADPIHQAMERVSADCLQKDPAGRRQRIQNAVIELKLARRAHSSAAPARAGGRTPAFRVPATPPPSAGESELTGKDHAPVRQTPAGGFRRRLTMVGLATLILAASGLAAALFLHQRPPAPVVSFSMPAPEHTSYAGPPSISPDGQFLTFSAAGPDGPRMLWLRALDEPRPHVIADSEGGFAPFWSPDSEWIAFFANRALKRVHLKNGQPDSRVETIAEADPEPGGGAWNKDGVILFAPGMNDGLYKIMASGGTAMPVLKPDASRFEHAFLWPQFLPDGKHFIFFNQTGLSETTGVFFGALEDSVSRKLFSSDTNAVYSPVRGTEAVKTGYLLYMKDRDLMRQGFDPGKLEILGDPAVQANDIGSIQTLSLAPVSVSSTAVLVYQSLGPPSRQLMWFDRTGKRNGMLGEGGNWGPARISPDGSRVAAGKADADGNSDLWLFDAGGKGARFVQTPRVSEGFPTWSPDGSRIAFWSDPAGVYDLYVKPLNGLEPKLLYKDGNLKYPIEWSRDGKILLFDEVSPGTRRDVMALSLADGRVAPIVNTVNNEGYPALSPDGRWLAFQSDDSGHYEVYVQRFEGLANGTKRRWQISSDARNGQSGMPRWRADGRELFYITSGGGVMSVETDTQGGEFRFDSPKRLFQTRPIPKSWNLFDVSPDGQRFLLNLPLEWSNSSLITVMTNWTEKLKS